ncbi:MAG: GNAT family N-acetyltransferase, partial [Methylovulum sp.]|nr:GNAT family N-acetyltransferase [Methylovulum sp.]
TPLGLTYSDADLAAESDQLHLVGFVGSAPVACALLQWTGPGVAKMRQVAVRQDLQGQGLGKCLVKAFEKEAGRRGVHNIVLHARQTAVAFYRSLNYEAKGGIFEEIGIPHQKMVKLLDCDFR